MAGKEEDVKKWAQGTKDGAQRRPGTRYTPRSQGTRQAPALGAPQGSAAESHGERVSVHSRGSRTNRLTSGAAQGRY